MTKAVIPSLQGIIVGTEKDIPTELLNRKRTSYNWDEFTVGAHREFSVEEAPQARSSAIAFGKGTKDRAPRTFASRTVVKTGADGKPLKKDGKDVKFVEIWRLADPAPVTTAESNKPEVTAENKAK